MTFLFLHKFKMTLTTQSLLNSWHRVKARHGVWVTCRPSKRRFGSHGPSIRCLLLFFNRYLLRGSEPLFLCDLFLKDNSPVSVLVTHKSRLYVLCRKDNNFIVLRRCITIYRWQGSGRHQGVTAGRVWERVLGVPEGHSVIDGVVSSGFLERRGNVVLRHKWPHWSTTDHNLPNLWVGYIMTRLGITYT